jgi:FkbM family methyltransferase
MTRFIFGRQEAGRSGVRTMDYHTLRIPFILKNWPTYVSAQLGRSKQRRIVLELRNGISWEIRTVQSDLNVFSELVVYQAYSQHGFALGPKDTIVDVGAHVGIFTALAARAAPKGRVFAFEPMADNYALLVRNVERNHLGNVQLFNTALTNSTGKKTLYLSESTVHHTLHKGLLGTKPVSITASTLGELFRTAKLQRIDLLKLDCEGSEYEILYGCKPAMLKRIKRIVMECHEVDAKRSAPAMMKYLEGNGFTIVAFDKGVVFATRADQ